MVPFLFVLTLQSLYSHSHKAAVWDESTRAQTGICRLLSNDTNSMRPHSKGVWSLTLNWAELSVQTHIYNLTQTLELCLRPSALLSP